MVKFGNRFKKCYVQFDRGKNYRHRKFFLITKGILSFDIVGLPNIEIRESRERVRSAILNSGFKFHLGRITVNLSSANLKKEGSLLDLCIAIGILLASKQIIPHQNISNKIILGELSLDGHVKNIKGTIPILIDGFKNGYREFFYLKIILVNQISLKMSM